MTELDAPRQDARLRPKRTRAWWIVAVLVCAMVVVALRPVLRGMIAARVRAAAAERGWTASWRKLDWGPARGVRIDDLALHDGPDTVLVARLARIGIASASLLTLRPRPGGMVMEHVRVRMRARSQAADSMEFEEPPPRGRKPRMTDAERAQRLRRSADQAVRMLFLPARSLPRVQVTDLTIDAGGVDSVAGASMFQGAHLDTFRVDPTPERTLLRARGSVRGSEPMRFEVVLAYGRDDHLRGTARLDLTGPKGAPERLELRIDGRVHQDRGARIVRLGESTGVTIGALPLRVAGAVLRRGPRIELDLAADGVTEDQVHRSLPPSMLGRLLDVAVSGSFDYRLHFDLDLEHPDSVDFRADVVPHGLRLDPSRTRLNLLGLGRPFTATIHLPRRTTTRTLSPANPHFRHLHEIDSILTRAVVTNEDGSFFRHRGFNVEAVKQSITENVRAGAYRRGAGTITMQLARNLWLGHERSLSRKMQEVVLAWILEHLAGVSKRRLLEIYFNIIEWGPGIHGADEAARFYFDRDARRLTVDEALFLAILVPSPTKWRWRVDREGALRPYARAQMHFIGRAMVAKGWLDPRDLSPADQLRIELRGPAGAGFEPPPRKFFEFWKSI